MEIAVICLVAFLTAILTFFSGFGLGTILLPAFAVFFPVEIAVALTGIVHFSTNVFKVFLIGKNADKSVLVRFGVPAIITSFIGAWFLLTLTKLPPLLHYQLMGKEMEITPVKLVIAIILIIFSIIDFIPSDESKIHLDRKKLVFGGLLSGFFGGLSGIQGAIRSAFLIRSNLSKEAYIATSVVIACLVDISRLSVYASRIRTADLHKNIPLIIAAILAAIAGAFIGNKLLKKITLHFIRILVAIMLLIVSIALGAGVI